MTDVFKVKTPTDFGIEYLDSPSHGNLKFLLNGDKVLRANSAIMSFNSPVIKKMTINDGRTTVDVQDFSKEAVQCFLGASYTGTLRNISKAIFRDVTKIAYEFEVTWLVGRCFKYFQSLTDAVREDNIADQVYVFEEAMFILKKLKKRNHIEHVINKLTRLTSCTEYFVVNYLSDITSCSMKNLDMIIEMTKEQQHILVKVLVNNMGIERSALSQNSRRILESLNFTKYLPAHNSLYQELLQKLEHLENPSVEDYRLIVRILRESNKPRQKVISSALANLPNLFHDFQQLQDIEDLEDLALFLFNCPLVCSSYVFYDAIYQWLWHRYNSNETSYVTITDSFEKLFADQLIVKGWKPLAREYVYSKGISISPVRIGGLNLRILGNQNLRTSEDYSRVTSIIEYTPDELFAKNHDIKFKLMPDCNCNKPGDHGFILRVTAASGRRDDSFNIQLLTDPNFYPDDIHLHDDSFLEKNIHFTLDITVENKIHNDRPVSWLGKPLRDKTNKYWCWGTQYFYKWGQGKKPEGYTYLGGWYRGSNAKIRPVVYYIT